MRVRSTVWRAYLGLVSTASDDGRAARQVRDLLGDRQSAPVDVDLIIDLFGTTRGRSGIVHAARRLLRRPALRPAEARRITQALEGESLEVAPSLMLAHSGSTVAVSLKAESSAPSRQALAKPFLKRL